ncbi:MAG: TetR/AcrR family transcriptional regulator [Solirubrobacteraceae bacterium]
MSAVAARAQVKALQPRNATEDAILAAGREVLKEVPFDDLRMDMIARRAFVSRTTVYFYFDNKRALVDRLIHLAFADMREAAAPYLDGAGEPRLELRLALTRVIGVVNANEDVLLLAAALFGQGDHLPAKWEPYIRRFVADATGRIRRDQERGIAPDDIDPGISAQALCAMVERHVTMEIIRGGRQITESVRVLSELWWRAVYSHPGRRARGTRHQRAGSPR